GVPKARRAGAKRSSRRSLRATRWSASPFPKSEQERLLPQRSRIGGSMATVIVGLVRDAHQARGLIRALDDAGFSGEDIDMSGGLLSELLARGVPDEDANIYAEGVRRGGALVCVRADDDEEALEAAELMTEHGALDIDACAAGWRAQPAVETEHYAVGFGEY